MKGSKLKERRERIDKVTPCVGTLHAAEKIMAQHKEKRQRSARNLQHARVQRQQSLSTPASQAGRHVMCEDSNPQLSISIVCGGGLSSCLGVCSSLNGREALDHRCGPLYGNFTHADQHAFEPDRGARAAKPNWSPMRDNTNVVEHVASAAVARVWPEWPRQAEARCRYGRKLSLTISGVAQCTRISPRRLLYVRYARPVVLRNDRYPAELDASKRLCAKLF